MSEPIACPARLRNGNPCSKFILAPQEFCKTHTPKDDRFRCIGRISDGTQCKKQAVVGKMKCNTHEDVPVEQQCTGSLYNGHKCQMKKLEGFEFCKLHHIPEDRKCRGHRYMRGPEGFYERQRCNRKNKEPNGYCSTCGIRARYEEHRRLLELRGREVRELWGDYIVMRLTELGVPIFPARGNVGHQIVRRMVIDNMEVEPALIAEAEFIRNYIPRQDPQPARSDLERITRDTQNVHTVVTVKQTNRNVELILKTPVPQDQATIPEIKIIWSQIFKVPVNARIYEDMEKWYNHSHCYAPNDYKYRHVLNHLWARIRQEKGDVRRQLYQRLQQECAESVNMCMEGHISRLAQVMVGFDDAYQTEVNANEELQRRIPLLKKITDMDERIKQATTLMAELNVSPEDAQPWLDALVDDDETETSA